MGVGGPTRETRRPEALKASGERQSPRGALGSPAQQAGHRTHFLRGSAAGSTASLRDDYAGEKCKQLWAFGEVSLKRRIHCSLEYHGQCFRGSGSGTEHHRGIKLTHTPDSGQSAHFKMKEWNERHSSQQAHALLPCCPLLRVAHFPVLVGLPLHSAPSMCVLCPPYCRRRPVQDATVSPLSCSL